MERRAVLVGAGSIGAAAVGGATLLGTVAADPAVESGYFSIEEYSIDTQNGRLAYLTVKNVTVMAEWENFDHTPAEVEWTLDVTTNGETKTAGTATATVEPANYEDHGDGDYDGYIQSGMEAFDLVDMFGVEAFEVPPDHEDSAYADDITEAFDVTFTLEAVVTDEAGNEVADTVTGESVVNVTNLGADVVAGGAGEYDGDGADDGGGSDSPSIVAFGPDGKTVSWTIEEGDATVVAYEFTYFWSLPSEDVSGSDSNASSDGIDLTGAAELPNASYKNEQATDVQLTLTVEDANGTEATAVWPGA